MQYHQLVDNYFFVFIYSHNIEDIEMAFAAFQMKKKIKISEDQVLGYIFW